MNWSKSMRQFHRWLSIAFTLFVIANFVVMALGMGQNRIALYVGGATLIPLFLLLFTGLYLFALPYLAASRRGARATQLGD